MVINKRNEYLQIYISSAGQTLPPDYGMYSTGTSWGAQCVFCMKPHSGIKLYRYDPISNLRTDTEAHVCKSCYAPIMQMKKSQYYSYWQEDDDISTKDEYAEADYGNRSYKINLFNTNYQFDESVDKYLIGRGNEKILCYFCGQPAEIDDVEVLVPVDCVSPALEGGRIKVCARRCLGDIWNIDQTPKHIHTEKCAHCSVEYLITQEEYRIRHNNSTLGKHMCPECTFSGVELEQKKKSILYDPLNKTTPYSRYIYHHCTYCNEPFTLDLTLLHSKLKKVYTTPNGTPRCKICYIFRVINSAEKIIVEYGDYFCVIFYLDKCWSYRISKIKNSEELVLFRPAATYKVSNKLTALADAITAINELIGTQIEIDYGTTR